MRPSVALLVLLLVSGCSGKRAADPVVDLIGAAPSSTAPVLATPIGPPETRIVDALAGCTRMACPDDNACCNTCRFGGWGDDTVRVEAAPGSDASGDDLPTCEVDGCGKCSQRLEVIGAVADGVLTATQWRLVP